MTHYNKYRCQTCCVVFKELKFLFNMPQSPCCGTGFDLVSPATPPLNMPQNTDSLDNVLASLERQVNRTNNKIIKMSAMLEQFKMRLMADKQSVDANARRRIELQIKAINELLV